MHFPCASVSGMKVQREVEVDPEPIREVVTDAKKKKKAIRLSRHFADSLTPT